MTNYNLEEFKNWLNEDLTRKKGKSEEGWKYTFDSLFSDYNHGESYLAEDLLEEWFTDETLSPYSETIKEWKSELDQRERERERAK